MELQGCDYVTVRDLFGDGRNAVAHAEDEIRGVLDVRGTLHIELGRVSARATAAFIGAVTTKALIQLRTSQTPASWPVLQQESISRNHRTPVAQSGIVVTEGEMVTALGRPRAPHELVWTGGTLVTRSLPDAGSGDRAAVHEAEEVLATAGRSDAGRALIAARERPTGLAPGPGLRNGLQNKYNDYQSSEIQ